MQKCMQCGYERQEKDNIIDSRTCPHCGIIYDKWQPEAMQSNRTLSSRINNSPALNKPRPTNTENVNKKLFLKYAVGLLIIISILIILNVGKRFITIPFPNNIISNENKIEKAANDLNKRCPLMITKDGRLDAVYYDAEINKVTFFTTLVNIAWENLPGYGRDEVLEKTKSNMINYIKQDENMHAFYRTINVTCIIKTNDAIEYGRVKISPSDY